MRNQTATAEKHVCKFRRHQFSSGNVTYFCANGCSKKIKPALALGKPCICWRCGNTFIMTEYSIRLAKPHCDACHRPKNASDIPEIATIVHYGEMPGVPEKAPGLPMVGPSSLSERLRMAVESPAVREDEDI